MTADTCAPSPPAEAAWRPRLVAILLFDDVEVLDFAGAFEVRGEFIILPRAWGSGNGEPSSCPPSGKRGRPVALDVPHASWAGCPKSVYIFRTEVCLPSEIWLHISDMTAPADLKSRILARISDQPPKRVWTVADFLDLGNRDAVDKALQRLVHANQLRRIDWGLYDKPRQNSLTKQGSPPDPREVIDAVARRDQIRVLVDGMTAANDLGLTNAVPAKIVVHTDARLKPIRLGNLDIVFKPAAASKLYWAGRPAMRVVQALHWLRDTTEQSAEAQALRRKLRNLLAHDPRADQIRTDLREGLTTLPAWMQELLRPLLDTKAAA
jgi:hypothetical protein